MNEPEPVDDFVGEFMGPPVPVYWAVSVTDFLNLEDRDRDLFILYGYDHNRNLLVALHCEGDRARRSGLIRHDVYKDGVPKAILEWLRAADLADLSEDLRALIIAHAPKFREEWRSPLTGTVNKAAVNYGFAVYGHVDGELYVRLHLQDRPEHWLSVAYKLDEITDPEKLPVSLDRILGRKIDRKMIVSLITENALPPESSARS